MDFGAPHKKPTSLLTNVPIFDDLSRYCNGQHQHITLAGSVKVQQADGSYKWSSRTLLAGRYPRSMCRAYAHAAAQHLPRGAFGGQPRFTQEWVEQLRAVAGGGPQRSLVGEADAADECPDLPRAASAIRKQDIQFPRKGRGLFFGTRV